MKDCKISDDGKVTGTYEEVLAYEEGLKNPLGRMRFPYDKQGAGGKGGSLAQIDAENAAILAFANLAPLIADWRAEREEVMRELWTDVARALVEGFDAACALIPEGK